MAVFVLVHGAYHGGWCWRDLMPLLEGAGAEVLAPDLPGHGDDQTPLVALSLELYADHIADIVQRAAEVEGAPVTLVGHSMAGMVISGVAERVPDAIAELIYLAAYLPRSDESIGDLIKMGDLGRKREIAEIDGVPCVTVSNQEAREVFYQDAAGEVLSGIIPRLAPEPVAIFKQRVTLTEANFGRVKKSAILARYDLAIPFALQQTMAARISFDETQIIDSGHSPFVTQVPALADLLLR